MVERSNTDKLRILYEAFEPAERTFGVTARWSCWLPNLISLLRQTFGTVCLG